MTDIKIHSEPWNCTCPDHQVWRSHSDYCNCISCKAVAGARCDRCHAVNNPLTIPYFMENGITLCESCESMRDTDLVWRQSMR
jgi:hypothetical protein